MAGGAVTRFAPSPTGPLHLGHAYAALVAQARGARMLLRIEDIDQSRARPDWEAQIYADLAWLGVSWPLPVLRQSERISVYKQALDRLGAMGLTYGCACSRADIRAALSAPQEGAQLLGPDGLVYPNTCRDKGLAAETIRLNMDRALKALRANPVFEESGPARHGPHRLNPDWMRDRVGDVVLWRAGPAYHLAVVVDDAEQGISEVTRGEDLFEASFIHILLQSLLDLPIPRYHHHALIRDDQGKRLAKRDDARALALYRAQGATPQDIRAMLGL